MSEIGIIVVAGGSGQRMGASVPKQFLPLAGKPILVHTVERLRSALPGARMIIALPADQTERWLEITREYGLEGTHTVCAGGHTRFGSVRNALQELGECGIVAVHDGVRPLVSAKLIGRVIDTAREYGTAIPAVRPDDSLRIITPDGHSESVDRTVIRAVQTPQAFRYGILVQAYKTPYDLLFTDDASVVERAGTKITLCEGDPVNIKITAPLHITLAEALLKTRNG